MLLPAITAKAQSIDNRTLTIKYKVTENDAQVEKSMEVGLETLLEQHADENGKPYYIVWKWDFSKDTEDVLNGCKFAMNSVLHCPDGAAPALSTLDGYILGDNFNKGNDGKVQFYIKVNPDLLTAGEGSYTLTCIPTILLPANLTGTGNVGNAPDIEHFTTGNFTMTKDTSILSLKIDDATSGTRTGQTATIDYTLTLTGEGRENIDNFLIRPAMAGQDSHSDDYTVPASELTKTVSEDGQTTTYTGTLKHTLGENIGVDNLHVWFKVTTRDAENKTIIGLVEKQFDLKKLAEPDKFSATLSISEVSGTYLESSKKATINYVLRLENVKNLENLDHFVIRPAMANQDSANDDVTIQVTDNDFTMVDETTYTYSGTHTYDLVTNAGNTVWFKAQAFGNYGGKTDQITKAFDLKKVDEPDKFSATLAIKSASGTFKGTTATVNYALKLTEVKNIRNLKHFEIKPDMVGQTDVVITVSVAADDPYLTKISDTEYEYSGTFTYDLVSNTTNAVYLKVKGFGNYGGTTNAAPQYDFGLLDEEKGLLQWVEVKDFVRNDDENLMVDGNSVFGWFDYTFKCTGAGLTNIDHFDVWAARFSDDESNMVTIKDFNIEENTVSYSGRLYVTTVTLDEYTEEPVGYKAMWIKACGYNSENTPVTNILEQIKMRDLRKDLAIEFSELGQFVRTDETSGTIEYTIKPEGFNAAELACYEVWYSVVTPDAEHPDNVYGKITVTDNARLSGTLELSGLAANAWTPVSVKVKGYTDGGAVTNVSAEVRDAVTANPWVTVALDETSVKFTEADTFGEIENPGSEYTGAVEKQTGYLDYSFTATGTEQYLANTITEFRVWASRSAADDSRIDNQEDAEVADMVVIPVSNCTVDTDNNKVTYSGKLLIGGFEYGNSYPVWIKVQALQVADAGTPANAPKKALAIDVPEGKTISNMSNVHQRSLQIEVPAIPTGIGTLPGDDAAEAADGAEGDTVYYTLQGVRVQNPISGLYIKVQGNRSCKVLVK